MKNKLYVKWSIILLIMFISGRLHVYSQEAQTTEETLIKLPVKLNDTILEDSLLLRITSVGTQVEVKKFMTVIGGGFHPFSQLFRQKGLMVQYGRFISFAGFENPLGFVNCEMVKIAPPVTIVFSGNNPVYFAPLLFLSQAISGDVIYNSSAGRIDISVPPPTEFGSIFPPARDVARALNDSGFTVQQGEINKMNPVNFCIARYTPNANGNNASYPYLGIQIPPSPGRDSIFYIPITFTLNEDEAMVMLGKTPPECLYFSYRSYLMNRMYDFPSSTTRTKINASLGESNSLYRMREDLSLDSMFNRKFALIMAADSLVAMQIKSTILASAPAISAKDIYFDIIPNGIFKFGNKPQADWASFLHRISLFKNITDQNNYINNPPLEIMRITPKQPTQRVFFRTPSFLSRTSGHNEFSLIPDVELLEKGIYNAYHKTHEIIWLQPSPWAIEGYTAIQERADALGDIHDALYITTSDFQFRENDIALVYGVNHKMTGQATYTNVNIYGKKYLNGFGGFTNFDMEKSARRYMADTLKADKLYAYSLSRHPVPGNPYNYIVPSDTNRILQGINVNDTAFIAFRLYVNPNTKIGPDPLEVILDRTVLLRPITTSIAEFRDNGQSPALKVFPNPMKDKATLEFSLPEWSEVRVTFHNSSGQQTGKVMQINHVRGTVLQGIQLTGDLPSGIYYLQVIIHEPETSDQHTLTSKILFIGGKRF